MEKNSRLFPRSRNLTSNFMSATFPRSRIYRECFFSKLRGLSGTKIMLYYIVAYRCGGRPGSTSSCIAMRRNGGCSGYIAYWTNIHAKFCDHGKVADMKFDVKFRDRGKVADIKFYVKFRNRGKVADMKYDVKFRDLGKGREFFSMDIYVKSLVSLLRHRVKSQTWNLTSNFATWICARYKSLLLLLLLSRDIFHEILRQYLGLVCPGPSYWRTGCSQKLK